MKETFSIKESLSTGWDIFKENWKFLVMLGFLMFFIQAVSQLLSFIPVLGAIASIAISIFVGMGIIHIFLQLYDNKKVSFEDLFSQGDKFWIYLGTSIVVGFIVLGGSVLLLIPGIIASFALSFPLHLVIDRNMGVTESIRTSWAITQGYKVRLFGFFMVALLVNLLGLFAIVFGLLVSVPVTLLALIHIYRTILARAEASGVLPIDKLQTTPKVFLWIGALVLPLLLIVGIGSSVFLATMSSAREKARDAKREADVKMLQLGAELYYDGNNATYPASLSDMAGEYIPTLPVDPETKEGYSYTVSEDGKSYKICAELESKAGKCVTSE